MSLSIGIIGLPNVGKSTFFTALTKKQVDASNYPFCTIEPNIGVVAVPDERLDKLSFLYQSDKIVSTTIEFVDIAGLIKGAAEGEGLGNKFLSHIREVDAIVEIVRDFKDENITHVQGKVDPAEDIKTVNLELILADLEMVNNRLENLIEQSKTGKDKEIIQKLKILEKLKQFLESEKLANNLEVSEEEMPFIKELNLLTAKPIFYVYNTSEDAIKSANPDDNKLRICAKLEAELASFNPQELKEYFTSLGVKQTGLDKLIMASYSLLNLVTFFTAGPKETHAWTCEKGTLAPQAAGKIHSDFEKGFIRAEIINWNDLFKSGSETKAKEKGLVRTEGKNYEIQDGDVVYFLAN